jgi:PAS domain S-box-containing protein
MPPEVEPAASDLPHAEGGLAIFESDGRIRGVSPVLRRLLGRAEDERMRRAGDIVIHPDDAPRATRLHEVAEHTGTAQTAVLRLRHSDGGWVWIDAELGIVEDAGPPPGRLRYLAVRRDVSEARRQLLSSVVAAREEERIRIANDVHDDTVQAILAVEIKLDQLRKHLTVPRQMELADELRDMVRGATARLRDIIFELQPPGLPLGGLAGAVADFAAGLFDGGTTHVGMTAALSAEPSPEAAVVVYRIAQEALRNVWRHATATTCSIRLGDADGGVTGSVEDDGVGFAAADLEPPQPGHRGMASMRQRAELAGGWARVESRPSAGTTVSFWVPDHGAAEAAPPPD